MFCPDCGTDLPSEDIFCQYCGYPVDALRQSLDREKTASIGWAERIIGKKHLEEPVEDKQEKIDYFVEVKEQEIKKQETDTSKLTCETCKSKTNFGTLCENCGDKLPTLGASDNFFFLVLSNFFRFLVAPAHFARTLPYPTKGGIVQALLVPAILTGIFILSLPAMRLYSQSESFHGVNIVGMAFIGMTIYIILVPILLLINSEI